ncbi:TonB-dependent receptor [Flavobacterium lutivivi]|jgi:outer membrane receptor protein involved in Fe transport|nr:TonB-dependent receptor [Flavobacterium lutivivi]
MKSFFLSVLFLISAVSLAQETKPQNEVAKDSTKNVEKTNELKEVTIYGKKRQFVKIESDKTTVSIKDNPMLSTGNAFEAVKKIPGVIASPIGGLTLNGKGVRIYIDGAPSTLSGTDLENYLASLPANAIEKIELIYNPGAAFDANSSGSIINLITSSKKLKGVNASFNINYNFNKYQKPSPQILLNGKEKNLSWQTMIGYNYIESDNKNTSGQTFTAFNPDESLFQKRFDLRVNRNFYFRTGTNYKLSEKSNLLFNYNLNLSNDRSTFDASTTGTSIEDYFNKGTNKEKNNNHEISLQYKTKLDTLGRTLDVTGFTNIFGRTPKLNSNAISDNVESFNNTNNDFKLLNYYLKYDFVIPFQKKDFSISTGGKFNTLKVDNTGNYFLNTNTPKVIDFDYNETNLAFYAEARKKFKKLNVTLGLRYENFNVDRTGITNGDKTDISFNNSNLFPNVSALYEVTNDINLVASYNRKISQPSYQTLDPNGSNFDQYNTNEGNIFLNPSFYDNYEFKITAMQFVQLGANYTVAKDHNLFIFDADADATEPVSIQTFEQFEKYRTFSAYLNFPIPLDYFFKGKDEFQKRMANIDKMNYIYLSINYIKNVTEGYDFSFGNKPIWNYAAEAQIQLPWNVKGSMSYYILPSGNWEIYRITKPIQEFSMSFHREFMDKKLKIGLHAFDLFNTNEVNALVSSTNLQTQFYEKRDSRHFRISLTYNFGNLKLERENTEIQTEKVKSGGGLVK